MHVVNFSVYCTTPAPRSTFQTGYLEVTHTGDPWRLFRPLSKFQITFNRGTVRGTEYTETDQAARRPLQRATVRRDLLRTILYVYVGVVTLEAKGDVGVRRAGDAYCEVIDKLYCARLFIHLGTICEGSHNRITESSCDIHAPNLKDPRSSAGTLAESSVRRNGIFTTSGLAEAKPRIA